MKFCTTKNRNTQISFLGAVAKGIPDDGGLYTPSVIPLMEPSFFNNLKEMDFKRIAFRISDTLFSDEIPKETIYDIVDNCFDFEVPLVKLSSNISVLELFHGPTLAFKDFGARFMAGVLSYISQKENTKRVILAATSGDTGSAVANGFLNTPGIEVILLYPSKKVSKIQEQQLTTLGQNITALEVNGTFDDCQRLVKEAFACSELTGKIKLTSANSINVARLIPQSFYYHYAFSRISDAKNGVVFAVPSGNLGNLTGGLIAKRMGLPVHKYIAALNSNDIFSNYLKTGLFSPKPSVNTISNAMDVGNPSNFQRITHLFDNKLSQTRDVIFSDSYSDENTFKAIKEMYNKYSYLADPHGSVAYLAIKDFMKTAQRDYSYILLETAHPAKFFETVFKASGVSPEMPERLKSCLDKEKQSVIISSDFNDFKEFLLKSV